MLIDFHVHCFNPKIAERAISLLQERANIVPFTRGLTDQTLQMFDKWGVDKGVLLPIATKPTQQQVLNDWCAAQKSDRFIPFGSLHPKAPDHEQELERIKSLGLKGIKLHPDYQDFMIDDEDVDDFYTVLENSGLPVVFHAGFDVYSPDLIHCTPERAAKMVKRHPRMKIVFAHLGGNDLWEEVFEHLAGIDGEVYFDTAFTSRLCGDEIMKKIIKKHGADRILFASDCPWDSPLDIKNKILALDLADSETEKILCGNAIRLLGL